MAICEGLHLGLMGCFLRRLRYCDDVNKECLAGSESDTMVNLGEGMDPRECHIPGIDKVRCFEVDLRDVIKRKRETDRRA